MAKKILFSIILLTSSFLYSQVGIGTTTPSNDSALETSSTTKGVLITRVSLVATNNAFPLTTHVSGMIVYNTSNSGSGNTAVFSGFYYNNGSQWIQLEPLPIAIGDVKQSLFIQDHDGWYLLDGRNITLLSSSSQLNAASIGFTTSIPNASDKFLKGKSSSESLSATGGNNSVILTQSNLPNTTLNGTANTAGNHTHDYTDRYHGVPENLNLVTGLLSFLSGVLIDILDNDVGTDLTTTSTSTSTSSGNHNHTATINTGGSSVPIGKPSNMVVNTFVYLGK